MAWFVRRSAMIVVLVAVGLVVVAGREMASMARPDELRPGAGVTRTGWLSDYLGDLRGSCADTPVFWLTGARSGGTVLVVGGTHGDEPAGYLTAVVLTETAKVHAGRLVVIPRANASGFSHNVPQEAHPQRFEIATSHGTRTFTFGARATNSTHQWPDPQVYVLPDSGQTLSGIETRNLNRAYPGRSDGTLTERVAFAITTLIRREHVDLAIDLHEAAPEYPVVNTIVAHERAGDLAALVNLNLQARGIAIGLESSPRRLHGLSHREWGDATETRAVLIETANPAQGRLRGRTDAALVLGGRDRYYLAAAQRRRLNVPFDERGWPLDLRVARHLAAVSEFAHDLGTLDPRKTVALAGVPDYTEVVEQGLGAFLR